MLKIRRYRYQRRIIINLLLTVIAAWVVFLSFFHLRISIEWREHQLDYSPQLGVDWPTEIEDDNIYLDPAEPNYSEKWKNTALLGTIELSGSDTLRKRETMKWWKHAPQSQLQHTYVNMHKYTFIMNNESLCHGDVILVICIQSDPEKPEQRNRIRQTWGSVTSIAGRRIVRVFLTARRFENGEVMHRLQERLQKENSLHNDIIQGDFHDSYLNLTYKTIMALHWVKIFCPHASFVLKTDDDVMVNTYALVAFLKNTEDFLKKKNAMLCHRMWHFHRPLRDVSSKWYVTWEEYPLTHYADYCNGMANIITQPAVKTLYAASSKVPFYRVEDVFTGFCAQISNTRLIKVDQGLPYWNTATYTDMEDGEYDWLELWKEIANKKDYIENRFQEWEYV